MRANIFTGFQPPPAVVGIKIMEFAMTAAMVGPVVGHAHRRRSTEILNEMGFGAEVAFAPFIQFSKSASV